MGKLSNISSKLDNFYLPDIFSMIIRDNEKDIVELNREQLREGKRDDGTMLPDYSPASVAFYGKIAGPMTLLDTGDFQDAFYIDDSSTAFEIRSSDDKESMLVKEYGANIFGLAQSQRQYMAEEIIKPNLVKSILNLFK